jgi:hypothetical protein
MTIPPDDERTLLAFGGATPQQPAPTSSDQGAANALPVGTRLGEFEITGLLGEGGFGIVYLAYDRSLERRVALKEYMPSSFASRSAEAQVSVKSERYDETFQAGLRSFVNEARILAQFDHPALIKVYRFWEANGTAYMVMPYYQGSTLKQALLARSAPPDEAWLQGLLAPLLDTLGLIHEQQCFHRDISPDNIMMLEDGRPLLLDFGAARRAISGMQQAFTVIFKQGYAPIEQYAEMPGMTQGAWTDLFALASVIHFAIDGKPPPPAVGRIITDPYVPLASRYADRFSFAFLNAIDQTLSVKPEQRPQSADAMRALLHIAAPVPSGTHPAPPAPPARPAAPTARVQAETSGRGRTYVIGTGVMAGLLAAIGLAYIYMGDKPAPIASAPSRSVTAQAPLAAPTPSAAPAVAPPPAEPAAPAPFDPVAALGQIVSRASAERTITVKVAQSRVRIGHDRLNFSVKASHAGYVYVQMVGSDRNNFWLLFPNAVDKNNRVAAGQTLDLPRKGWSMRVEGPPGLDQFVVILSDVPRNFSAAGLAAGALFAEFPIARAAQLQRSYTGATPLFAGAPVCSSGAACSPTYGASAFSIEEFAR